MAMIPINMVYTDAPDAFHQLAFPNQHPNNANYHREEVERYQRIAPMLMDAGRQCMQKAVDVYNQVNNSYYIQQAKAAVRQAVDYFTPQAQRNVIEPLHDYSAIQQANPLMQRYIMAFPWMREAFHKRQCDGYYEEYFDKEEDVTANDHYDYRRVMNGAIQTDTTYMPTAVANDEVYENIDAVTYTYYEDLEEGDRELDVTEKSYVMSTWDSVAWWMEHAKDPTDKVGTGKFYA